MKIKIDQTRTYDDAGFRRRAACLCFKSECESEILLVSSSRYNDLWVVPGGGLEPGEDPANAAVREVNEEAGVIGRRGRLLDVFENKDRNTRTYVYILVVEQLKANYDDANKIGRLRRWFSLDEANRQLSQHKPVQQAYIDKLLQDQEHQRRIATCAGIPASIPTFPEQTATICSKCYQASQHLSDVSQFNPPGNGNLNASDKAATNLTIMRARNTQARTDQTSTANDITDIQLLIDNKDMDTVPL